MKIGVEVNVDSVEEWRDDFSDEKGLDWSRSEEEDLDDLASECSENDEEGIDREDPRRTTSITRILDVGRAMLGRN